MRWFGLILIVVTGWGCVVPGSEKNKDSPIPDGQGLLVLNWQQEKSLLGSAWASQVADAYEMLLVGAPGNRSVDLTAGASRSVAVDPGTWRVIVFAGIKKTSGSSTAYLVASATAENVVVVAGQRATVDLILRSLDLTLAPAAPAYWKGPVTMTATGKSRNARLGMLLAGASTTSRPRFKSVELWNGYREASVVSGSPADWTAEATATVPDLNPAFTVALIGAGLCFADSSDAWTPTAGLTKLSWYWPNRAELGDTHPLVVFTEVTVPAAPPPTGMEVSLAWE